MPEHPKAEEVSPALGVQVNFVDGGLVLCLAFHHSVFDGMSEKLFLEVHAKSVRNVTNPEHAKIDTEAFKSLTMEDNIRMASLDRSSEHDFTENAFSLTSSDYTAAAS